MIIVLVFSCKPLPLDCIPERKAMTFKIIALAIIILLLIVDHALLVIAQESTERERLMYEKWKRERSDQ